ncbi:hypothetical protein B0I72DRAFT_15369 [Yarrowia lipolytica]|uniref:YALI0D06864p n=2 Tax=Yarrowia lipolytica TaxID=4952 RepID=Q6CA07_YARLI|nr:YALI0D06864p [Yarrowia lipolytica CLIB122]AOW03694.1 hypothetical protein YALI1_D08798g [Yarrowia lipolytica]KAB8284389.1 hypothetical protein BKA91DRAFT_6195 [Yarrowia lipolytica]KAE8172635.1 hypothetical protein BKA90DRAFT_16626 [Yarrowia lipolytica]KAJ8054703.1 hypothetical protein LXG23DRAFT_56258 [Yarrowia lipolytica]QNP97690.1 Putative membrane protein [Yarrowia lipolytica]|eukprot:XP_502505.1 YALI0D06864p [Yarrowia lipolytica CLIB122]
MNIDELVNAPQKGHSLAGMSIQTFLSSLVVAIVIFGIQLAIFILIRPRIKKLYEPRTYLVPPELRVVSPGSGLIDWLTATVRYDIEDVVDRGGLDSYFFLRFMRMLLWIFGVACCIIIPILVPINATGNTADMLSEPTGMDNLSWSNIGPYKSSRYSAHLVMAIATVIVLLALFTYELNVYIEKRHRYLTKPSHQIRATATTILIKYVPAHLRSEKAIKNLFRNLGDVKNVWFTRDYSKLTSLLSLQKKRYRQLECLVTKRIIKSEKTFKKDPENDSEDTTRYLPKPESIRSPLATVFGIDIKIPFLGTKHDSIEWHCEEIERLTKEIAALKSETSQFETMPTCMIQFNTQLDAHVACQSLSYHNPNFMDTRLIETDHRDVIWANMRGSFYEEKVRFAIATALNLALIIGWAIPVSVVGLISQISYLTQLLPFLSFLNDLPEAIKGAISGILPPLLLALLMMLVPPILTLLAYLKGISTGIRVQLDVQKYYYAFQYIQLFLVITVSSGLTTTVQQIVDTPTSTPTILANNLPKAANFFMSYLILQGMITSMNNMLRVDELIFHLLARIMPATTAHRKFSRLSSISEVIWGNTFPTYTNLATIGIIYSIISPIILIFCLISFSLTYMAFKYRIIYCNVNRVNSYGLFFPTAIFQLFTGIYTLQLCLIGLFFLVKDEKQTKFVCTKHAIIMIIVLAFTILYQLHLSSKLKAVIEYLPVDKAATDLNSEIVCEKGKQSISHIFTEGGTQYHEKTDGVKTEAGVNGTSISIRELADLQELETVPLTPYTVPENPFETPAALPGPQTQTSASISSPRVKNVAINTLTRLGRIVYTGSEDTRTTASQFMYRGIFDQLNTNLESISADNREKLLNRAFLHESLRTPDYICWVPEDELGVGIREIGRIRQQFPLVRISNDSCYLHNQKIMFTRAPPDYDEIKNMRL